MPSVGNNKRIAQNTLMLYFRMLLTLVVTLYTSRVVLNTLGVEDFGVYNVVGGVVVMFSFLNSAMTSGTQRFLSYELGKQDHPKLEKTFQATLNIHLAIGVVILLLAETIGLWFLNTQMNIPAARMDAARWIYQFSILSFLVTVIQVPYNASIIAHERMNIYAYVSILEVSLKLLTVFALTWVDYDKLKLYAMLLFTVSFLIAFVYRLYCQRNFKECRFKLFWDRKMYSTLLSYAGWNLFGNLTAVGHTQGVNILLNIFFGPVVNTARGIAYQMSAAIQSFVSNFQLAVNPQIVKSYASGEKDHMLLLISQSSKYSFLLLSMLALPILLEMEYILRLWLDMVPPYAILFCRLIILNALIDSFSGPLMIAAQSTGRIKKYQSVVGTVLLLNLPVSYLFLKLSFQPESTLYISISLSVVALLLRLWILHGLLNFKVFFYIRHVVLLALVTFLTASILPIFITGYFPISFLRMAFVTFCSILLSLVSIYWIGLNRGERSFIKIKIAGLFHRKV